MGQVGNGGKWAPGNMSTRANRYLRQMNTLEHNGHLGPIMDNWAREHWEQMHTRKNEHQGKSAIGANGHFGANGYFGTNGHWGKWTWTLLGSRELGSEGVGVGGVLSRG